MSLPDHNLRSADLRGTQGEELVAARERVIALLTDRFADDSLTVDEFEARLGRLHSATTVSELELLVRDLTQGSPVRIPAPFISSRQVQAPLEGRVIALLGETKRTGPWVVPQRLEVRVLMGDLLIDLRDAVLPPGGCEIAVVCVMGEVRVLVPPGVLVEETVTPIASSVANAAQQAEARYFANPTVRITGITAMAEIGVRVAPSGEPGDRAWKKAKKR